MGRSNNAAKNFQPVFNIGIDEEKHNQARQAQFRHLLAQRRKPGKQRQNPRSEISTHISAAPQIIEDLQAALSQFAAIASGLKR